MFFSQVECPAGSKCPQGSGKPVPCEEGTFQINKGSYNWNCPVLSGLSWKSGQENETESFNETSGWTDPPPSLQGLTSVTSAVLGTIVHRAVPVLQFAQPTNIVQQVHFPPPFLPYILTKGLQLFWKFLKLLNCTTFFQVPKRIFLTSDPPPLRD